MICEEQVQIVTAFKLQKSEFRYFEYALKAAAVCVHCTNLSLEVLGITKLEINFLLLLPPDPSLNKIRFEKTQCEFRDYEYGR